MEYNKIYSPTVITGMSVEGLALDVGQLPVDLGLRLVHEARDADDSNEQVWHGLCQQYLVRPLFVAPGNAREWKRRTRHTSKLDRAATAPADSGEHRRLQRETKATR